MEKLRLKVQLAFAALFNIGLVEWHSICFPVFNCHSCPVSVFACPIGIIGQFAGVGLIPLATIGTIAISGLLVGRLLCGWACPFGFLQELLYKVPYIKFGIPSWTRFIKYGVFVGLVLVVPIFLTVESQLYFCRLCPAATIESAIPYAIMNGTANPLGFTIRLVIFFSVIVLVMGHRRFFCKVLCPLGACLSVFNRFALFFPERNTDCVECSTCTTVCGMDTSKRGRPFAAYESAPEECIACLDCWKKCPTGAVQLWGG